ncbi:uncharacterized protein E0L32_006164 [Thyridium curvatum]|uniref:D-lactate dehydratase n=1 Tax=Thyridium curvatum TaxID=1093900 RepID=A0A507B3Y2_9PEZI|nr:uncharacterized protein E0L32_006164 [Thyridium curvatum]TPX13434.1 hypothetical protein E0L32_006164 [Thyridium curvatum]
MAPKVLIILTSHDKLGESGKPTGWFLPELSHPYDVLKEAGCEITIASPNGGKAPLDPASVEMFKQDPSASAFFADQKPLWESTTKLSTIAATAADDYDALFYPGGHGPMFDLAGDVTSQRVCSEFAAKGKPVAAVCHGPAALVNVKVPLDGHSLLKGREVTGFSNVEEDQMDYSKWMPFMLEDKMNEASGGKYVKAAEPWGEKVVVDGNLITGQNPASAKAVGEAILAALKK